ncbi:MAG: hypothetical protein COT85_05505 [Chlamydiae bacterium CG10_big_fil_rev_8_21_14_0_10_42_34]|nr:MAG: hypothetical protein COT85_05505 [Chlamydiae bacterium CG10_big_fil_rev_8_21_14_0_10_42_34]
MTTKHSTIQIPSIVNTKILSKWKMLLSICVFILIINYTIPNMLVQAGWMDPSHYTGYIHHYSEVLERYGANYHSARIAFLYPARLTTLIFGSKLGYIVLRNILLFAAAFSIWKLSERFYKSTIIASFITCLFIFHPWFLRPLFWNHPSGFAIVYALLSLLFFINPPIQNTKLAYYISGAFWLFTANCQPFPAAILGSCILAWVIVQIKWSHERFEAKHVISFISGVIFTELFLMAIRFIEFPHLSPLIDTPAIKMIGVITTTKLGRMDNFAQIVESGELEVFVPFFFLTIFCIYVFKSRKSSNLKFFSATALLISFTFYIFCYLIFDRNFLGCFYYFSYLIIPSFFIFIYLIGDSIDHTNQNKFILFGFILYATVWFTAPFLRETQAISPIASLILAAVLIALVSLALQLNLNTAKAALIITMISLSPLMFYNNKMWSYYSYLLDPQRAHLEWDVYHATVELQKTLFELVPKKTEKIGFWFSKDSGNRYLYSIQNAFLGNQSRLFSPYDDGAGMPVIDSKFTTDVNSFSYIALLGITENEIEDGLKALGDNGIPTKIIKKRYIESKTAPFYLLLLRYLGTHRDLEIKPNQSEN